MDNAIRMRASVAFWTLSDNDGLGAQASKLLMESGSFLCVDIHHPTNLDVMANMSRAGANVYLHLKHMPKQTGPELRDLTVTGMPKHLLHQKFLLFDFPNGEAELWLGSHNWTRRALEGPNVEASLVVSLSQESPLYKEAAENLKYARDTLCEQMDPNQIDDYKLWQKEGFQDETDSTIVVEGPARVVDNLTGEFIRIFGTDVEDYQSGVGQLRIGSRLHFVGVDPITEDQYVYRARITATGRLGGINAEAESLGFREVGRWSDKGAKGRNISVLEASSIPPQDMVDRSSYWVTLQILEQRNAKTYNPRDKEQLWLDTEQSPLLDRMAKKRYSVEVNDSEQLDSVKPKIRIQVPNKDLEPSVLRDSSMDFKRYAGEFPLVVKRLIIPEE